MKRMKIDFEDAFEKLAKTSLEKKKTTAENLDLDYIVLLPKTLASELLKQLEDTVEYLDGDLSKVKVFGKWHQIPRQQVAYEDDGMVYRFSGNTIPAKPWTQLLRSVRDLIKNVIGFDYNFVLINRYRNGKDHIGEHKDNEVELDKNTPIASLSLGQQRVFVLKHQDARKKGSDKRNVPPSNTTIKVLISTVNNIILNSSKNGIATRKSFIDESTHKSLLVSFFTAQQEYSWHQS
ncbi:alpha-ketoglutarate-dependent dioxygenase alkB -like 2-like, partial [Asbolus verrucosus]